MTLSEHLAAAHAHSLRGGDDPAPACAREIPRGEIERRRAELQQVAERSHVARVQVAMLDRALALMP